MLGQGGRSGGEPAAPATEDNAGPAWFPSHPEGVSRALGYFEDSAERVASRKPCFAKTAMASGEAR